MPALGGALHCVLDVMPRLVFQICAPVFALSAYSNPSHDPTYTTSVGVPLMTSLATLAEAAMTPPVVKFQSLVSCDAFATDRVVSVPAPSRAPSLRNVGQSAALSTRTAQIAKTGAIRRTGDFKNLTLPNPPAPKLIREPYQEPERGPTSAIALGRAPVHDLLDHCGRARKGRRSSAPPSRAGFNLRRSPAPLGRAPQRCGRRAVRRPCASAPRSELESWVRLALCAGRCEGRGGRAGRGTAHYKE